MEMAVKKSIMEDARMKKEKTIFMNTSSSVLCPRAGPSLQTQAPRLKFCPKAGPPSQTQEPRLQFY